MITKKEENIRSSSFWKSRPGIMLQVIIILLPSAVLLKSGNLLLAGLLLSVLLAWQGLRLQQLKWTHVGLKRPSCLLKVMIITIIATLALILLSYILRPVITSLTGEAPNLEAFNVLEGNINALLVGLLIVWICGAFGEEMLFRGFMLNALYKILPDHLFNDRIRWGLSLLLTSALTAFGHMYQGITGMILTGIIGFCFGLIYLFSKRNLWPSILTHGLYDTFAFILLFSGFSPDKLF